MHQRHWHTTVVREGKKYITARTDYFDTRIERRAVMRVEIDSLKIAEAWLERWGRPGDMAEKCINIGSLKGIKAYLGNGRIIKAALQDAGDELERSLFNESVIAIVQAETFLFKERGYRDAEAYNQFWEKSYAGSCRYYSNLNQLKTSWVDFIGPSVRTVNLFNRGKSQQLLRDERGHYLINGSLIDTFHQLSSKLELDQQMKVITASGQLLRTPDQVCMPAAALIENLVGITLPGISKKELANILGAGQGCIHLIDLVYDSTQTLCFLQGQA